MFAQSVHNAALGTSEANFHIRTSTDSPSPLSSSGAQETPEQISKAALSGKDPIALLAVDMFLCILGAEAAHMGLRLLATGGVYICGGITPKVTS